MGIQEFENYSNLIFDALSEAVIIIDHQGRIISANREAYELFQFKEENLIGQTIEILIPEKFQTLHKKHRNFYDAHPHARKMQGMELKACRSNKSEFPVEISLNPVEIAEQHYVVAIIMDISQRKEMEEKLRESELIQAKLEHEQNIAEIKNHLVAMLSHELKTPLTLLNNSTEILLNYFEKLVPEKRNHYLELIKAQTDKLSNLLEDVLLVSKSGVLEIQFNPEWTNIEKLAQDTCSQLNLSTDSRFSCQIEAMEDVYVDRAIVEHVLTNLLSNAQKYTADDGQISLKIKQENQDLAFYVADTGIGIPDEDQAQLFTPFHRASNAGSFSGTGLGLAIAKTYIERHSGSIKFMSKLNKGTSFTVKLPITKP